VSVILSDRHASKSVTSTMWLCELVGKAVVMISAFKLEDFLGKALWSYTGIDIPEEDDGTAIVNKVFALASDGGVF
jgi:hypothetical protein